MLSEHLMNFSLFYVQEPFANRSSAWFIRKVAESWFLSDSCVLRVDMLQINRAGIYISHFCEHQDQFTRRTGWPTLWRSEHGGADECCRLHQRFKSSCKIQNWAEKTLHHHQQLVTVVCTLSTLIPIYNGLTTRWCYSGSAVSLTVCGSHVAPPNNQSGNVVNSFDPSWCWTHDHVFTVSEETQYAENEQGLWNVEEKAGAAGGSDSRGEPKVSWNAADWRDCNHMDKKELEATCTKIRWGWCTNPSQKITCPRVRTANRV